MKKEWLQVMARSEMSSEAQNLISMCRSYLSSQITVDAFVKSFQEYYEDYQERLSDDENDELDNVYMACEFYEPDDNIRGDDRYLLDENRLREIVERTTNELEATSAA